MKTKKFLTLLLGLVLVFSMTAYTAMANDNAMSKGNETMSTMDNKCECGMADKCECDATAACGGDCSDMYEEPQSVEEALALHKKLMAQENATLSCGKRSTWRPTRAWRWWRTAKTTASSSWTP